MPDRCTVYGCSNTNSIEKGISLHRIPFWEDQRPEAKKRRKKWVKFVESKRQKWTPSSSSVVCSDHFLPEDYETFYVLPVSGTREYTPRLKKDAFGIAVYPTVYKVCEPPPQSDRSRRQDQRQTAKVTLKSQTVSTSTVTSLPAEQQACQQTEDIQPRPVASVPSGREPDILSIDPVPDEPELQVEDVVVDEGNHPKCGGCVSLTMEVRELKRRTRQLRNNWLGSRFKLNKCRQLLSSTKTPKRCECNCNVHVSEPAESEIPPTELEVEDYEMESEQEDVEITEEEPENDYHADATDTDTTETDTDDDEDGRVYIRDDNIRTQPKYMVFLTHLLLLFKFCPFCKEDNPLVETKEVGTAAVVTSMCTNPECSKEFEWHSQPKIPLTRIYAGNFLLCFSILLSGASPSKILQIFRHMGLACVSLKTYFAHQRKFLFPSILIYWKEYQRKMIDRLKSIGAGLVIAGDGRHDSMGHSAKYCAYTIFCCTVSMIIHFDLVQRNEAGSSPAMEYMAFNQCMTYLLGIGLGISTFISDRHTGIAKHMREKLGNIKHYFDLWHLKKSITKVLTKIARLSGFKAIADWIKPCGNHFYWSACSTHDGNGSVIWAKFKTFLSHIVNKHKDLADPLYNRCNHGPDISHRQWLLDDSDQYNKVYEALTNTKLESAIKKASPLSQTSCLEGFHSVLNQFAPKMFSYSYIGMFCRHVLAAVHFNSNLHREVRQRKDGSEQVKIVYPKFKNGEGTVRDVKKEPVFDYVEEIFQTTMDAIKEKKLDAAIQELKNMTPPPMNTMLEKQPRQEVLQKRDDRRRMSCNDVPPTTPVSEIASRQVDPSAATRSKPHCSVCKHPMKGHKQITTCPRNRPASPSTI